MACLMARSSQTHELSMLPSDFDDVVAFEESTALDDEEWTVETLSDSSGRSNNVVVNTARSKTQGLRPAEPANG